ncbi:glycoside hydrolase family protein [Methylobacterium gossipiicola]|uniref:glycoside hydrolase family protein n=1 Tax=Methylobacterium gossipiicola TaxID=582675 RepID=UPI001FCDF1AD|nr:hypothetical protein [Methylobacterium gossipiicola]
MDLSSIGAAVLIAREGRRLKAYSDSVGVWTIGIGVTTVAGRTVAPDRAGRQWRDAVLGAQRCRQRYEGQRQRHEHRHESDARLGDGCLRGRRSLVGQRLHLRLRCGEHVEALGARDLVASRQPVVEGSSPLQGLAVGRPGDDIRSCAPFHSILRATAAGGQTPSR